MDTPRYTVTVTSVTHGWTVTATHGDEIDLDDPDVRVLPVDPFVYSWGFADDLIPGPLDPDRVTLNLWSRTAADEPDLDLGDVLTASVRLGVAGPVIARVPRVRVTDVETTVLPGEDWRIRTTVSAVDYRSDLAATYPNATDGNGYLSHRYGLIGQAVGLSIGVPNAWPASAGPHRPDWTGESSGDHAAELLAAYVPDAVHHALVPYAGAGYPAGYRYADTPGYLPPGSTAGAPIPDPATTVKLIAAPAGRKQTVPFKLPLAFVDAGGTLDIISSPGGATPRMPAVSARYCEVPATARRSRDHLVNTVVINGVNAYVGGGETRPSAYTHRDAAGVAARGPITRTVDTQLILRFWTDPDQPEVPGPLESGVAYVASTYLAQPSTTLAYKDFVVLGHKMPQAVAEAVLPYLTPSYPGDGGDGRVVRHLTIASLPEAVRLPDADASGFITSGQLAIEAGQIRYQLTTTPGRPELPNTPTPITVGEFTAAGYSSLTVDDIAPTLTTADLDLVDA